MKGLGVACLRFLLGSHLKNLLHFLAFFIFVLWLWCKGAASRTQLAAVPTEFFEAGCWSQGFLPCSALPHLPALILKTLSCVVEMEKKDVGGLQAAFLDLWDRGTSEGFRSPLLKTWYDDFYVNKSQEVDCAITTGTYRLFAGAGQTPEVWTCLVSRGRN